MRAGPYGLVDTRFEPVRETFASGLGQLPFGGAAFAVWAEGTLVIDLWGGGAGGGGWREDTRAVLMSVTKGLASIACAQLVDQGLVDVDAPVSAYWPEFSAQGKEGIPVRDLLTHSIGLLSVDGYEDFLGPLGEGWHLEEEIVTRLAAGTPEWAPGTVFGYHGLTFGWLVAELVRRVTGESVGTLIRRRFSEPLGLDLDLGTPQSRLSRVALPILSHDLAAEVRTATGDAGTRAGHTYLTVNGRNILTEIGEFFANPSLLELELPAINATGTARALATLYGELVRPRGVPLLSPGVLEMFAQPRISGLDAVEGDPGRRALGFALRPNPALGPGHPNDADWGPGERTFGHQGYGGQISFADPDAGLGVGFVRTYLSHSSPFGRDLVERVYECL